MSSRAHVGLACSLLALFPLCGCAHAPSWAGGEPASIPPRPASASAYPPVFEIQAARRAKLLTAEEQERLQADLAATRNRTMARAKATATAEQSVSSKDDHPAADDTASREGVAVAASN
jgi:hypothetical protein